MNTTQNDMFQTNSMRVIHPKAQIGGGTEIGPFVVIEEDVIIGQNCQISPHVTIMNGARIGDGVKIFPGAVISAIPQDLKYRGEPTLTFIGDNTTVREYCTLNRGTNALGHTKIGKNCLLMAYVHIAHDCVVGNHCVLANNVTLAGHITIDDFATVGGLVAVHQFVRIGRNTMIGGGSLVRKDVPPFIIAAREPLSYAGINRIGLSRRGFSRDEMHDIEDIYRILFVRGYSVPKAMSYIETDISNSALKTEILTFIDGASRGILRGFRSIQPNTKLSEV
jgi:UDP-N-acetylglucosamine acyltransferase